MKLGFEWKWISFFNYCQRNCDTIYVGCTSEFVHCNPYRTWRKIISYPGINESVQYFLQWFCVQFCASNVTLCSYVNIVIFFANFSTFYCYYTITMGDDVPWKFIVMFFFFLPFVWKIENYLTNIVFLICTNENNNLLIICNFSCISRSYILIYVIFLNKNFKNWKPTFVFYNYQWYWTRKYMRHDGTTGTDQEESTWKKDPKI